MNKICTSIEQSKKLIELGIDVRTADMHYFDDHYNIETLETGFLYSTYLSYKDDKFDYIPAWSLSALLGFMPIINDSTYKMCGTLDGGALISHEELTCVMFQENNPLDAVFEMVCWLKEKNLL